MKYQVESYDHVIKDMMPLIEANSIEMPFFDEKVEFAPNYYMFKELDDKGLLKIFTARDDCNNLTGYCVILVTPHIHYSSSLMANVDTIYIVPEYRGKFVSVRLIKFTEKVLKEMGVKVILHHVPKENDFSPILIRMGYEETETIYKHYIGD